MDKVRRELPASAKYLQRYSSKLMKAGDMATLTAYQCKQEKNPETVDFYSKTKCDVDVADQMARQYSVKAGTRRWPVTVFYNVLDLAGINACMLHKKRTGDKVSSRDFQLKLATELREDYIVERSSRNVTIARPHHYQQLIKETEAEKCKQCQIVQTALKTKPTNFVLGATKLYVVSVSPWTFSNALYVRHQRFSNFLSSFCPCLQIKLFFLWIDRVT